MWTRWLAGLLWAGVIGIGGCGGKQAAEDPECAALCDVLVLDCGYGAFPKYGSCMEGCLYNKEEGAAISQELRCVEESECDTFAILECEHAWGVAE